MLEDPGRDEWQKPHEVMMALKLKPTDVVADIGAGTGYFARRFAMHAAKVYAVDIDAGLLAIAAKSAPVNLVTIVSKADNPLLAPASVDVIFFCDVLHHLENRPDYYRVMSAALKRDGRVVVGFSQAAASYRAASRNETGRGDRHCRVQAGRLRPVAERSLSSLSVLSRIRSALG